jgi:release factor glutamine methyltransferase
VASKRSSKNLGPGDTKVVMDAIFRGLSLRTAPGRVMTPRAASEQLVAAARGTLGDRPGRVVDVGTGSGAVALAIAAELPNAFVWATDTSPEAVALARENARRHDLDGRVTVRQGDLLEPVPGELDLVVANLPYLPAASAPFHPDLVPEPEGAVYADGDGLDPYRRLLAQCSDRLASHGSIALQLHRRVLTAMRDDLAALRAQLAEPALIVA